MNLSTTSHSQKKLETILSTIFASAARVAVLRALLVDPTRAYYQRQLEAATGQPIRAIQRELERLSKIGLLYRHLEGNRAYYRVDPDFPLYQELRRLVLKTVGSEDQLRSELVVQSAVRLAFLSEDKTSVLVVTHGESAASVTPPLGVALTAVNSDEFLDAVRARRAPIESFLNSGVDLLGRRDDLIWRHIEAAGFTVNKGVGVV